MHYAYDLWINCVVVNPASYWLDVAFYTERRDKFCSKASKNMCETKLQAKLLLFLLISVEGPEYYCYYCYCYCYCYYWGYVVTQWFEALRYKSEGCGFDSRWCH